MLVSSPATALHTPLFESEGKQWRVGDERLNLDLTFEHEPSIVMTNVVTGSTVTTTTTSDTAGDGDNCCDLISETEPLLKNLDSLNLDDVPNEPEPEVEAETEFLLPKEEGSPSLMASILQELEKKQKTDPPAAADPSSGSPGKKSALSSPTQEPDKSAGNNPVQQTKQQSLKRVSFGSSKGSMVETLIYDDTCPLERTSDHVDYVASEAADGVPDYRQRHRRPNVFQKLNSSSLAASEITESHYERASLAEDGSDQEAERSLSKVRVTFYESQRPLTVNSPDPPGNPFRALDDTLDQSYVHSGVDLSNMVFGDLRDGSASFNQTLTAENGSENPFRPDGELSKEADAIVERIREGKPLTPTRGTDDVDAGDAAAVSNSSARGQHAATSDSSAPAASMSAAPGSPSSPSGAALAAEHVSRVDAGPGSSASPPPSSSSSSPSKLPQSPGKPLSPSRAGGANGNTPGSNQPTSVEVQRSVVGSPTQQVERVVIKKTKSKNKCCVIQ